MRNFPLIGGPKDGTILSYDSPPPSRIVFPVVESADIKLPLVWEWDQERDAPKSNLHFSKLFYVLEAGGDYYRYQESNPCM